VSEERGREALRLEKEKKNVRAHARKRESWQDPLSTEKKKVICSHLRRRREKGGKEGDFLCRGVMLAEGYLNSATRNSWPFTSA